MIKKSRRSVVTVPDFGLAEYYEKRLVASLIACPEHLFEASNLVSGSDFFDRQYAEIFDEMVVGSDAGKPISERDLAIVCKRVFQENALAEVAFIREEPTPNHWRFFAENVYEASKHRRLFEYLSEARNMLSTKDTPTNDVVSFVDSRLSTLDVEDSKTMSAFEAGNHLIASLLKGEDRHPVTTGLYEIDSKIGGVMPGELLVLAARPGNGKTSFAMQIANRCASSQLRAVLFVSIEMTAQELRARTLAADANVEHKRMRTRDLNDAEKERLVEENAHSEGVPLFIFDKPSPTLHEIRGIARLQNNKTPLALIVIDYIGLVKPRDQRISRHEQIGEITGGLKALAKELQVPIMALSQLNREADGKEPKLSNLRESGNVEQDADVVFFLHRDGESNSFKLICAKHRHGQTGSVNLIFEGEKTRFTDPNQAMPFSEFEGF